MSDNKALAVEVSEKAGIPEDDAMMFLGILARSGLTGRDGATSLIAALNTPNGTPYGADGIRAAAILNATFGWAEGYRKPGTAAAALRDILAMCDKADNDRGSMYGKLTTYEIRQALSTVTL